MGGERTGIKPVIEPVTGIPFPFREEVFGDGKFELFGVGVRIKYAFVRIYGIGVYMNRQCFSDEDNIGKLLNPDFPKTVRIVLHREVTSEQYISAVIDNVTPRMQGIDLDKLEQIRAGNSSGSLKKGAEVFIILDGDKFRMKVDCLDVDVTVKSRALTGALCDLYFGNDPVSPTLKDSTMARIQNLVKVKSIVPDKIDSGGPEEDLSMTEDASTSSNTAQTPTGRSLDKTVANSTEVKEENGGNNDSTMLIIGTQQSAVGKHHVSSVSSTDMTIFSKDETTVSPSIMSTWFPKKIENGMILLGYGVRSKFFRKLYALGFYMHPKSFEQCSGKDDAVPVLLDPKYHRTISCVMKRKMTVKKFLLHFVAGVAQYMFGEHLDRITLLQQITMKWPTLAKRDEVVVSIEGETVVLNACGKKVEMKSEVLSRALCHAYCGKNALCPAMRKSLLAGIEKLSYREMKQDMAMDARKEGKEMTVPPQEQVSNPTCDSIDRNKDYAMEQKKERQDILDDNDDDSSCGCGAMNSYAVSGSHSTVSQDGDDVNDAGSQYGAHSKSGSDSQHGGSNNDDNNSKYDGSKFDGDSYSSSFGSTCSDGAGGFTYITSLFSGQVQRGEYCEVWSCDFRNPLLMTT